MEMEMEMEETVLSVYHNGIKKKDCSDPPIKKV